MNQQWWCPVCGIPRTSGWNGQTRCECGTASATNRPTHAYLTFTAPDGTKTHRSLAGIDREGVRFELDGIRIGRERIPWQPGVVSLTRPQTS